ncbi:MAG: lytic murein transglycosylase [Paracoccaceae bacterium]
MMAANKPNQQDFSDWLIRFETVAKRRGISKAVFDQAFSTVTFDPSIVSSDRQQPENTLPIWRYLEKAVSNTRVKNGKTALSENAGLLNSLETTYGIPAEIIVAIWGLESAYGTIRGELSTVQSLATLAYEGRREQLFETQLIAALKIVQSGAVTVDAMLGSWAGAMGHTQLMPTSFLQNAVDFDGDGHCNIWAYDPTDALATTAKFLQTAGWHPNLTCMSKVKIPPSFNYALSGPNVAKSPQDWEKLGVITDQPLTGPMSILLPAGANGPAFLTSANFNVLLSYNRSVPYCMAVSHLAAKITGAVGFAADWPVDDTPLDRAALRQLQVKLTEKGFNTKGADGLFGENSKQALQQYQHAAGLIADGYPTLKILQKLGV